MQNNPLGIGFLGLFLHVLDFSNAINCPLESSLIFLVYGWIAPLGGKN